MIGAIAGQGGFNPKDMSPKRTSGSLTSATETTLVSISGSGVLTSISQIITATAKAAKTGFVRIIADGVDFGSIPMSQYVYVDYQNSGAIGLNQSPFFKFNSTLVVKHTSAADLTVNTSVYYLLD